MLALAWLSTLAVPSVTLPADDLGIRRFQTPPLVPGLVLGQSFVMTANGFRGIEVFPTQRAPHPSTYLRFDLYELQAGEERLVRTFRFAARDLVGVRSYRFDFARIADSKDRTYRLDLVAVAGQSPPLWATRGERYRAGRMYVNGRERWADLAFRTYAPVPSVGSRLVALYRIHPGRALVAVAAFLGFMWLTGVAIQALHGTD